MLKRILCSAVLLQGAAANELVAAGEPDPAWMNIQGIGWDYGPLAQHRFAQ